MNKFLYKKKTICVWAMQITKETYKDISEFTNNNVYVYQISRDKNSGDIIDIIVNSRLSMGNLQGELGDYIVLDMNNEVNIVKQSIFEKTYEFLGLMGRSCCENERNN